MTYQPPTQPFQPLQPRPYQTVDLAHARRRRRTFIVGAIAATVLLLGGSIFGAILMLDDDKGTTATQDETGSGAPSPGTQDPTTEAGQNPPADGVYLIQVVDTELCIGAGPEKGNTERTVAVLADCGESDPPVSLTKTAGGFYQLGMNFVEEKWEACLSIDPPAEDIGYLLGPYDCAEAPFGEFTVRSHPSGGYQILVEGTQNMCVDALDSRAETGTAMAIMECDDSTASQRFDFVEA